MTIKRNRRVYAILIGLVVIVGLASRSEPVKVLPSFFVTYAGDTLWSLALFLVLGFIFPSARTWTLILLTVATSFAVEFSQLYRSEWINAVRDTRIGALTLGAGFKWSDLGCYTVGTLLGVAGELAMRTRIMNRQEQKP